MAASALYEIVDHLHHMYEPRLQRLVCRVLWMPVVFAWDNLFAIVYPSTYVYFVNLTGWYEGFALWSFYAYLECYLERGSPPGSLPTLSVIRDSHEHKHLMPFTCLRPWRMSDGEFVRRCKIGVLQYTVVISICTLVVFITEPTHTWNDGVLSPYYAYSWITAAVFASQFSALYCLLLFYHALKPVLLDIRPLPKFLCIKLVIFFIFWQELAVYGLVYEGYLKENPHWSVRGRELTENEISSGIQSFIICCEMLLISLAHAYAFPVSDYAKVSREERPGMAQSIVIMFSVSDLWADLKAAFGFGRLQAPSDTTEMQAILDVEQHPSRGASLTAMMWSDAAQQALAQAQQPPPLPPKPPPRKGSLAQDVAAIVLQGRPEGGSAAHPQRASPPMAEAWAAGASAGAARQQAEWSTQTMR
jgi:hypothetical protein